MPNKSHAEASLTGAAAEPVSVLRKGWQPADECSGARATGLPGGLGSHSSVFQRQHLAPGQLASLQDPPPGPFCPKARPVLSQPFHNGPLPTLRNGGDRSFAVVKTWVKSLLCLFTGCGTLAIFLILRSCRFLGGMETGAPAAECCCGERGQSVQSGPHRAPRGLPLLPPASAPLP